MGEERVGSRKLSSDRHLKALVSNYPPPKMEGKKKEKFLNDDVFFKKKRGAQPLFTHTKH